MALVHLAAAHGPRAPVGRWPVPAGGFLPAPGRCVATAGAPLPAPTPSDGEAAPRRCRSTTAAIPVRCLQPAAACRNIRRHCPRQGVYTVQVRFRFVGKEERGTDWSGVVPKERGAMADGRLREGLALSTGPAWWDEPLGLGPAWWRGRCEEEARRATGLCLNSRNK